MANPQLGNGYTPIANEIVEALWKVNLSAYESRVLWYLFRRTYGWQKKTDFIALSQFSKHIGLDRRLIHRALNGLSSKKMIVIYKDDRGRVSYGFQKNYEHWKVSSKKVTVINLDDGVSSVEMTELSSKEIPTKEIIKSSITKENTNCASDLAPEVQIGSNGDFYLTHKKRKLTGKRLETFERFWEAFGYKKGRAQAADSWIDIPQLTESLVQKITEAAKKEAEGRPGIVACGRTPIFAQGWLAGRRWEDETEGGQDDAFSRLRDKYKDAQ
jgi:phage replication O-like protein O